MAEWLEPYGVDKKTDEIREKVLRFLEGTFDYSMVLDLPTFSVTHSHLHGLDTWQKCLQGTLNNNDYFAQAREPGATKFLNVLQGNNWKQCEEWYEAVKPYSTGEKANFEGWAIRTHVIHLYSFAYRTWFPISVRKFNIVIKYSCIC
jgi:hypothetical protein